MIVSRRRLFGGTMGAWRSPVLRRLLFGCVQGSLAANSTAFRYAVSTPALRSWRRGAETKSFCEERVPGWRPRRYI